ncbi:MAG: helicase C-terminal domain-containing protein [Dehalococcoidia bacterium]
MNKIFVSIDLETTGFDHKNDKIIEVGAVKFKGNDVLEELSILINPNRKISDEISELTGINQLELNSAKQWEEVKDQIVDFIDGNPIIGHNVNFENLFLAQNDVKISDSFDTLSLSRILLPSLPEYNLGGISKLLGFNHENPHRALSDSMVTMDLFNILRDTLLKLDSLTLEMLYFLGKKNKTNIYKLIKENIDKKTISNFSNNFSFDFYAKKIDEEFKIDKLENYLPENYSLEEDITNIYQNTKRINKVFPKYEYRDEQKIMSDLVTKSITNNEHIILEAGTGVGKSYSYLLPALISIIRANKRVVISTNTIPLQEQILSKDLKTLKSILKEFGYNTSNINDYSLKGRSNYICLHKVIFAITNPNLSSAEIEFLSKIVVWLQTTTTGEKNEINISTMENIFDKYSHKEFSFCVQSEKNCFFKAARKTANFSNLLIVNHSLLFSDLSSESSIIPKHDILILDESHHIDDTVTQNLSFELGKNSLDYYLRRFSGKQGILSKIKDNNYGEIIEKKIENLDIKILETQQKVDLFFDNLSRNLISIYEKYKLFRELRITQTIINEDLKFDFSSKLQILKDSLNSIIDQLIQLTDIIRSEHTIAKNIFNEVNESVILLSKSSNYISLLLELDQDFVFWFKKNYDDKFVISGAPLDVSEFINSGIFSDEKSIILTGATLNNNDNYLSFKKKLGNSSLDSITIDSTYDYSKNSLVILARDFPDRRNNYNEFIQELSNVILDNSNEMNGPMLVLCTNYDLMYDLRSKIKKKLNDNNIRLLVQKFDGSAKKIIDQLNENLPTVAIGNYTFWEGVDLHNKSFETIIMTALPFPVFTNPLHQARSELFDNAFLSYHLPLATTKFRQGFGRLIRSKNDTGIFIVLDHRIATKKYGNNFLTSLPAPKIEISNYKNINYLINDWKLTYGNN